MHPGERECKLYVQKLPALSKLAAALSGEGSWAGHMLGLEAHLQDGWSIVSHTFDHVGQDEEDRDQFLLSCILVK